MMHMICNHKNKTL